MTQKIAIFVSKLARNLNMDESVCFCKLQKSLFNEYDKSWSGGGKQILLRTPYISKLVLYVEDNAVSYSPEEFHYYEMHHLYTPIFINGEFEFPILKLG